MIFKCQYSIRYVRHKESVKRDMEDAQISKVLLAKNRPSVNKIGRKDFSVYEDGIIRCIVSRPFTGKTGMFNADRTSPLL